MSHITKQELDQTNNQLSVKRAPCEINRVSSQTSRKIINNSIFEQQDPNFSYNSRKYFSKTIF